MQNALDILVGTGKNSRAYIQNAITKNMLPLAVGNQSLQSGSPASVIMMTNAIAKKRILEASESSLFMRYVHPLMTFMEGFIYALTPIMAVLVAIGSMGMSLAGKYLLMLLWIQLWMPVLAIVNLYLNMSVQGRMASLQDGLLGNIDPTSIMGQVQMHSTMADWLATAGTLAAATPALALMLIYGSAVTATNLSGKLGGNESVDPNSAAPDAVKSGPVLNDAGGFTTDGARGANITGAEAVSPSLGSTTAFNKSTQAAHQQADTSSHNLSAAMSNGITHSDGSTDTMTKAESLGHAVTASKGETSQAVHQWGKQLTSGMGFSAKEQNTFDAKLAAGLSAQLGGGASAKGAFKDISRQRKASMGGEGKASLVSGYSEKSDIDMKKANQNIESATKSHSMQASFNEDVRSDESLQSQLVNSEGWSQTEATQTQEQFAQVATDQKTATQMDASVQSMQSGSNMKLSAMMAKADHSDAGRANDLMTYMGKDDPDSQERFQTLKSQYTHNNTFGTGQSGEDKAITAAALQVAWETGDVGIAQSILKDTENNQMLPPAGSDAHKYDGAGNSATAAASHVPTAGSITGATSTNTVKGFDNKEAKKELDGGKALVQATGDTNAQSVNKSADREQSIAGRAAAVQSAESMIKVNDELESSAAVAAKQTEAIANGALGTGPAIVDAAAKGASETIGRPLAALAAGSGQASGVWEQGSQLGFVERAIQTGKAFTEGTVDGFKNPTQETPYWSGGTADLDKYGSDMREQGYMSQGGNITETQQNYFEALSYTAEHPGALLSEGFRQELDQKY